jgi:uncharacterized membrane protein
MQSSQSWDIIEIDEAIPSAVIIYFGRFLAMDSKK